MSRFPGLEDLPAMFADFGRDLVFGSDTVRCLFDEIDEEILPGEARVYGKRVSAKIITETNPGIEIGSSITITAVGSYVVRDMLQFEDGAITELLLRLP